MCTSLYPRAEIMLVDGYKRIGNSEPTQFRALSSMMLQLILFLLLSSLGRNNWKPSTFLVKISKKLEIGPCEFYVPPQLNLIMSSTWIGLSREALDPNERAEPRL